MADSIKDKIDCQIEFIKSSGGRFEVFDGEDNVFSKARLGRFPELDEIMTFLNKK